MNTLDQEEAEILEAFEAGNVKRAKDAALTQKRHQGYAEAMLTKDTHADLKPPFKTLILREMPHKLA